MHFLCNASELPMAATLPSAMMVIRSDKMFALSMKYMARRIVQETLC